MYGHPEGRKVVFVGDLIDRGLQNFEVVRIAKSMTEAGQAITVMGNHEFNAICFRTRDGNGEFLRKHTSKNIEQHHAFLYEVAMQENAQAEWQAAIDWFKTLPIFIETENLRIVHACWDQKSIDILKPKLGVNNTLPEKLYVDASTKGDPIFGAIETLLKGDEKELPDGITFVAILEVPPDFAGGSPKQPPI
ncbi:MAG: hypothetical protein COA47_03020 [Robiginitomaculum sp.]|nr:MAG: hypothetical protein COA47_03020 [Robiginitomaculum sp.]